MFCHSPSCLKLLDPKQHILWQNKMFSCGRDKFSWSAKSTPHHRKNASPCVHPHSRHVATKRQKYGCRHRYATHVWFQGQPIAREVPCASQLLAQDWPGTGNSIYELRKVGAIWPATTERVRKLLTSSANTSAEAMTSFNDSPELSASHRLKSASAACRYKSVLGRTDLARNSFGCLPLIGSLRAQSSHGSKLPKRRGPCKSQRPCNQNPCMGNPRGRRGPEFQSLRSMKVEKRARAMDRKNREIQGGMKSPLAEIHQALWRRKATKCRL